jgi:RES domain-containing protein
MHAWRLCRERYADLTGQGASLAGGRWNSPGRPMLYTADHPALCMLEVRVHLDLPLELLPGDYVLLKIAFGDAAMQRVDLLPERPRAHEEAWLAGRAASQLRVPSVLVPGCWNLLLNPGHAEAALVRIEATISYRSDARLWV